MADIEKCSNNECPLADCYRKTAKENPHWQAWGYRTPYVNDDNKIVCDHYYER